MPYTIVRRFEKAVAEYAGSKYAVAVSSCSNAIFLCCHYLKVGLVYIPKHTYPSVPASIKHAGGSVIWTDEKWKGIYQLYPYLIYENLGR